MEENKNKTADAAEPVKPAAVPAPDIEDDDIATPEDIAAEKERRARLRAERKAKPEEEKPSEYGEYNPEENAVDPYLEPDPTIPFVPYKEPMFLSRGCKKCPKPYEPVSSSETGTCGKMTVCNWMSNIHKPNAAPFNIVEVRFKNNRKDFFMLPPGLEVEEGDVVAVEGMPGHDVGIVSLTGELCRMQMKNKKVKPDSVKRLFRRAKSSDIERWMEAVRDEHEALLRTRRISEDLGLVMKVNDVEYQGDHSKAIFYYTADDRVDFRTLIKVLADEFKVRVEMKQIGVRQEAGKVGGIGTCGRELCCSTWLTNFQSVTTGVAKTQQILPNPQKLAGQCGKLKCCLNFEYEVYADALKQFPPAHTPIRFQKGLAMYKKTDVLRGIMWYAYEGENELYAITAENVKKIIEMNKNQQYPEKLEDYQVELMSTSALAQETTNAEFEQELKRLVDSGNGVVNENEKPQRTEQRTEQREDRRDKGDRRNGDNRQRRDNNNGNGGDRRDQMGATATNRDQQRRDNNRDNGGNRQRRDNGGDQQRRDNNRDNGGGDRQRRDNNGDNPRRDDARRRSAGRNNREH